MQPGDDRIIERIFAEGVWLAESGLHTGGEKDGSTSGVDMVLQRDASNRFFIPGSSIAGAARNALARRFLRHSDYETGIRHEPPELRALFGFAHHDDGFASALIVEDAPAAGTPRACVRDGVRIQSTTGVAAHGHKYDFEVLPAGTAFAMRFQLVVHRTPSPDVNAAALFDWFAEMLRAFQRQGDREAPIRLGARTRRGLGLGAVKQWRINRLMMDATHRGDVLAWLRQAPERCEAVNLDQLGVRPQPPEGAGERFFEIQTTLKLKTSLLIRSAGVKPGQPDTLHLTEAGAALLPGTSLAGILRHRVERIAKTVGIDPVIVDRMFGPHGTGPDSHNLFASRVWVSENTLANGGLLQQGRVAIDRFTGGARDAALFEEAAFWPQQTGFHVKNVTIRLVEPKPQEAWLLLLAFKDLWTGDLPLGGESSIGRGVCTGVSAVLRHSGVNGLCTLESAGSDPAQVRRTGPWQSLEEAVRA